MSQTWFGAALGLLISYLILSAIYNLYFSPLAKYPGPFLAKISAWPNFYYSTTGYRHIWIWRCHELYGPAVRFKPDGILFNSPAAYRAIYQSRANVKRGKFYEIWSRNPQNHNTLFTTDKMVHARKRRVLNSAFSEQAIRSAAAFVIKHVDRWNQLLTQGTDEWTLPQNMSLLNDHLIFDIMGDLCFGKSFEIKEPGQNPFKHIPHSIANLMQFMYPIAQSPFVKHWVWLKPRGLDKIFEILLPNDIRHYYEFVEANVEKRRKEEEGFRGQNPGVKNDQSRKDMFYYLLNATDDRGNPGYSIDELHAEANLLIIAGSDTTATALSGFWFYLLRHPRVYTKLVKEVRTAFQSANDIEMGKHLLSCQYLRACIDEGLRLGPAGLGELARVVLPGGLDIEGNHIPEGVHVGVTTWSIMHNQEYFGDPWTFRPERWIVDDNSGVAPEDVTRAQAAFNPFGIGQDNCVGQKLAMEELLITVARTLYRMDVRLAPGDSLGGGDPGLGWGLRDKNHIAFKDVYTVIRDGPMVQFRNRQLS